MHWLLAQIIYEKQAWPVVYFYIEECKWLFHNGFSYELQFCLQVTYITLPYCIAWFNYGLTSQNACNELGTIKWILWLLSFKRESNKLLIIY